MSPRAASTGKRKSAPRIDARKLAAHFARMRRAEELGIHIGMDEAGLGPVLGPMVIGWSALRVVDPDVDPWEALKPVVSRRATSDKRKIVVADSKVVFDRSERGEKRLELTALTFLAQCHASCEVPPDARALIDLSPTEIRPPRAWFDEVPWTSELAPELPRRVDAGLLEIRAARLARELARGGLEVADAGARVLTVAELNGSFRATDNKSRTHWDASAPVLRHLWERHGNEGLFAVVDRHGGRMRYGKLLSESLDGVTVDVVLEDEGFSEYAVHGPGGRRMRIAFCEKGDRFSFPVALASCCAKYVREVCMEAFNRYFARLAPDLKPTAGYYNDGWRWLNEAEDAIARSGIAREALIRER